MSLLGVLTGTKGAVDTHRVFHRHLRVAGVYVGSVAMFEDLVRALEATSLKPVVDRTFGFEEAPAAYEHLARAGHVGKVVDHGLNRAGEAAGSLWRRGSCAVS